MPCEAASTLLDRAQLGEAECAASHEELLAGDMVGPDMRSRVHLEVLAALVKKSPKLQASDLDALLADVEKAARADASIARLDDVTCPGISSMKGNPPPTGTEVWCETKDGKRHGPAVTWNAGGERVRTVEHRHGAIEHVEYRWPESGDLPMALFVCPAGETLVEDKQGELEIRACEKDGQRGTFGRWKAGTLVDIESPLRPGELPQNRFDGFMNQPE